MEYQGVTFTEAVPASPEESFVADASRATRVFYSEWTDRFRAAVAFVGYPSLQSGLSADGLTIVRYISRQLPLQYPAPTAADGPNLPNGITLQPYMWCGGIQRTEGISPDGVNDNYDLADYVKAKLTLNFFTPTYDLLPDAAMIAATGPLTGYPDEGLAVANGKGVPNGTDRYVTRLDKPAGRFITVQAGFMSTVSDPSRTIPTGVAKFLPNNELSYVWHSIPAAAYPINTIAKTLGCVNDATFDGYPAGTLRLDFAEQQPGWTPLGQRVVTVQYRMKFEPNFTLDGMNARGHNGFYTIPPKGTFDCYTLSTTGKPDGTKVYRQADFAALFRPDQP
jgi:hypothetical protein